MYKEVLAHVEENGNKGNPLCMCDLPNKLNINNKKGILRNSFVRFDFLL